MSHILDYFYSKELPILKNNNNTHKKPQPTEETRQISAIFWWNALQFIFKSFILKN